MANSKKPVAKKAAAKKPLTQRQLDNLAAQRAKKDANVDPSRPPVKDRWAALLSGQLTVRDLDDDEIRKFRVRGPNGFQGRPRVLPSHIQSQFQQESICRAKRKIVAHTDKVTKELLRLAYDEDVPAAQRAKILMYLLDRQLGKAPETVRVEGVAAFDQVLSEALGTDRNMVAESDKQE